MKCELHRDKEAIGFCSRCGRRVCEGCLVKINGNSYCKECQETLQSSENESLKGEVIVCDSCGGYYKLEQGESLEDFDKCQCGGNFRYLKNSKEKKNLKTDSLFEVIINKIDMFPVFIGSVISIFLLFLLNYPYVGIIVGSLSVGWMLYKEDYITMAINGFTVAVILVLTYYFTWGGFLASSIITIDYQIAISTLVLGSLLTIVGAIIRERIKSL